MRKSAKKQQSQIQMIQQADLHCRNVTQVKSWCEI